MLYQGVRSVVPRRARALVARRVARPWMLVQRAMARSRASAGWTCATRSVKVWKSGSEVLDELDLSLNQAVAERRAGQLDIVYLSRQRFGLVGR